MKYSAKFFANLFQQVASEQLSRKSYKGGVGVGNGNIPYDTGALQAAIYVSTLSDSSATITIGNDADVAYASLLQNADRVGKSNKPNMHKGFVEKFILEEYVRKLSKYGKVEIE